MRAKAGQGRVTLQGVAALLAADLGHDLGRFHAAEGKAKRSCSVLIRGRLVEAKLAQVFRAVCRTCGASAIVDQHQWQQDRKGFGGRATKEVCAGKQTCDNCGRAFLADDLHVPDPPGDMRFCDGCSGGEKAATA